MNFATLARRFVMNRSRVILVLAPLAALASRVSADEVALAAASADGLTTVRCNERLLLEYRSEANPSKLYVSQWCTPQGIQVLRDSPHDHVHHRALMFAVGVDEVDFWSEAPEAEYGRQVAAGPLRLSTSSRNGRGEIQLQQSVRWLDLQRQPLAVESRTIVAHVGAVPRASLLSWCVNLAPSEDRSSLELWGRHYFGLGMRFVESMDQNNAILVPEGTAFADVRGTERLARANWCALQGSADGNPVTVAMFDAPANPRHPATWFSMTGPFAYLSATLNLEQERLTVTAAQPLKATYGVALWDGHVTATEIEQAYQTWLELEAGKEPRP